MKEATGELNMTVAIVVGIAGLAAFFYFSLWPTIKNNMNSNTKCSQAICEKCPSNNCSEVDCHLKGSNQTFKCVWKG